MILSLPESLEERMELHLLDTSVLFPIVFGNKKKVVKLQKDPNFPSKQKIVKAVEKGSYKKCAVTTSVVNELVQLNKKAERWFTYVDKSLNAILYLTKPSEKDDYLLEQFNALASKKRRRFGVYYSIATVSIQYAIPSIVTDDEIFFAQSIRGYLVKKWRERWWKCGRKYLEIITSKDFCQLYL